MRKDAFVGTITVMGDVWRRFILDRDVFPFRLWRELHCTSSTEQFLEEYGKLQEQKAKCPQCFDVEFSHPFLDFIPGPCDPRDPDTIEQVEGLRHLLTDLAAFSPLSSDLCECLHGFHQKKCHRASGAKPDDSSAQQITLWASILASYKSFWDSLWKRVGDFKVNFRLHRFGKKGCNQWSKAASQSSSQQKQCLEAMGKPDKRTTLERVLDVPKNLGTPKALSGSGAAGSWEGMNQ